MSSTNNKKKILIIDDDRVWGRVLSEFLKLNSYSAIYTTQGATALDAVKTYRPDCILLDFHLKDMEADAVCEKIRSDPNTKSSPIIIVSADPNEEITSYQKCMADNFILKGTNLNLITAAIESLLRRLRLDEAIIEQGDLRLESKTHLLYRNSKPLFHLSTEQFRLFFLLLQNANTFVSEAEISRHLYPHDQDTEFSDAIKMLVYRLRVKLGPQLGRRIKNKRNLGWIYVQPNNRRKK